MPSSTDVGDQPWMQVLDALYREEMVIEAHGPNISLNSDATVFDTTDLSEDEVISEVGYLLDADLITWIDADEEATEFKQHRLTKEGFQIIHEQKQAERQLEWREENAKLSRRLTLATIVLAITAIFQVLGIFLNYQPPVPWDLVLFYSGALFLITAGIFAYFYLID